MSKQGEVLNLLLLKRVLQFVNPYRGKFIWTGFLTLLLAFISPVRPWLIQHTLDEYVLTGNQSGLGNMVIIMIAFLFFEAGLQFYQTYMANWIGQSVIKDIRGRLYAKLLSFKLKYYDQNAIGKLVTRVVSDIETISDIFSQGLLIIIGDILKLVVVIGFMLNTDIYLTVISLISIPLLLVATNIFKNVMKSAFQDVRTQVSQLNAFVQEHITGMTVIQIFNKEVIEQQKFQEINSLHRSAHVRTVWANAIFFPVVEIMSASSIAVLIWLGLDGMISGNVSFGNLVAFILYIHMLFRPIRQLADRFNTLQMGIVGSDRVFKILDTDEHIEDAGNIASGSLKGNIVFDKVDFSYKIGEPILKKLSFKVDAGKTLALVGATGAGKSTIINILSRFYEFNGGEILVDGIDIRKYDLAFLRRNIGVVLQDVFLFSDSILNNVTLNNPNISRKEVEQAAKDVGALEFINKMPGGLDYNVRERGGMLSVGQRQLISFIRAYVYNPSVLILDEATSSVDGISEELIQFATAKLTSGRTSIIIAHRLSTIKNADKILVIANGEVVESGNHTELIELEGAYRKLHDIQLSASE